MRPTQLVQRAVEPGRADVKTNFAPVSSQQLERAKGRGASCRGIEVMLGLVSLRGYEQITVVSVSCVHVVGAHWVAIQYRGDRSSCKQNAASLHADLTRVLTL